MDKPLKVIFAGTPEFSAPYLEGLLADPDFIVIGVLTQSDKPSGRSQALAPSAIKILAEKNKLKIWQPDKLRLDGQTISELQTAAADLLIVVAYGQIIPQRVLDLFPKGCINVHPSLLPKYRGASPIQSAILNGETETGISIMLMDAKMDHGPILAQEKVPLTGEETNESLHVTLAFSGVRLLMETIKRFIEGRIEPQPQNDDLATVCATITKEDGRLNWNQDAILVKRKIYAFYPWPATWTMLEGKRVKIFPPVRVKMTGSNSDVSAGKLEVRDGELVVKCAVNEIVLSKMQLEGKNEIKADDFIRGHKDIAENRLI